jgi:hypothetical protein
VCHRTVSSAPGDLALNSSASGIFQSWRAIIHRTCPVYTGQCPVLQEDAALELGNLGNSQRLLRYNSPDMSGVHRTVRCNCGATATSRQRSPATAINARQSAQKSGTRVVAHRTLYSTCPVYTGLSGAPYDSQPHQTASLVVGAINNPNHPPFIASKFSTSQPLTRARHSILDIPKRSNPLQFHTRL